MALDFDWLEAHIFHRSLSDEEKNVLTRELRIAHADKGEYLMREGETNPGIGLLKSGRGVVTYESHGEPVRIGDLQEGSQFGDMSVFEDSLPSASIMVREPCEYYLITREALDRIMHAQPALSRDLMTNTIRHLAQVVRSMNQTSAYAQQYIHGRRV